MSDREHARVVEVMHRGVISCAAETSALAVARVMAAHRIHCVVVWGDTDLDACGVWGVVSDLDLVAAGDVADGLTARSVAATAPLTVSPGESLSRAGQMMVEHGVSHLIVTDPARDVPVGILSTLDVARVLAS